MNVQTAAGLLNLSPITVRGHIRSGSLNAIKHNGEWNITPQDLQAFRESRRIMPPILTNGPALIALVEAQGATDAAQQVGVARDTLLRYLAKVGYEVRTVRLPDAEPGEQPQVQVVEIGSQPTPTPGTIGDGRYRAVQSVFEQYGVGHLLEKEQMCPTDCPRWTGDRDGQDDCLCDDEPCIYERSQNGR